jgi:hypothetical protein
MNDSYTAVKQQAEKEVEKLRAETIMGVELRMFKWQRKKMMNDVGCFADYLQVLVPTKLHKPFASKDEKELLEELQQDVCKVELLETRMNEKVAQLETKMSSKMDAMMELLLNMDANRRPAQCHTGRVDS